jgi:hypothetical protein
MRVVRRAFLGSGPSRRDDANHGVSLAVCVHDNEHSQRPTQPQQNEAVFRVGMIRVIDQPRPVVVEHGLGLGEGHPVFPEILPGFRRIPPELELAVHRLSVCTVY